MTTQIDGNPKLKAVVISLVFLMAGAFSAVPAQAVTVMPLGDSITQGGYSGPKGYQNGEGGYRLPLELDLLKIKPDILFVGSLEDGPVIMPQRHHEGHPGKTIEWISTYVDGWLKTYRPDVILLMIGTNNMWQQKDRDSAAPGYQKLLDKIAADLPKTRVYAASIINGNNPAFNSEAAKFNTDIYQIVHDDIRQGRNLVWVDMNTRTHFLPRDLADGTHPTAASYKTIADVWFSYLQRDVKK